MFPIPLGLYRPSLPRWFCDRIPRRWLGLKSRSPSASARFRPLVTRSALAGFDFPEVSAAVGRSEGACRQLAARARRHMELERPRFEADRRKRQELAARFFDALRDGDVDGVRELLAADVQMVGDGGGKAPALARSVIGVDNVARLLGSVFPLLARIEAKVQPSKVNGQPGAIVRDRGGKVVGTFTLDVLDRQI